MTKEKMTESSKNEIVKKLCGVIQESKLTTGQTHEILTRFLFSIGASLENCDISSSEQVLKRYASNPTLGNALMAQALLMRDAWSTPLKERKEKDVQ